jgi:hypothetical protein
MANQQERSTLPSGFRFDVSQTANKPFLGAILAKLDLLYQPHASMLAKNSTLSEKKLPYYP